MFVLPIVVVLFGQLVKFIIFGMQLHLSDSVGRRLCSLQYINDPHLDWSSAGAPPLSPASPIGLYT